MSRVLRCAEDVAQLLAQDIGERLVRRTILALQGMTESLLSGPDSGLTNVWDEICVQVQFDHSLYWDLYDAMVYQTVDAYVAELKDYERFALWLQTYAGESWVIQFEDEPDGAEPDVILDDLVAYIVATYVYGAAANWQNERIRTYLDRQYG